MPNQLEYQAFLIFLHFQYILYQLFFLINLYVRNI